MTAMTPLSKCFPKWRSLHFLVLLLILACAPISDAAGQTLRVFAVDLDGEPAEVSVEVEVGGRRLIAAQSDSNGMAEGAANIPTDEGYVWLNRDRRNAAYLTRRESFTLAEVDRFRQGFAIPLWGRGDVPRLGDVWIQNPAHIAVAVQRPRSQGDRSRIIIKLDRDVDVDFDTWLSYDAPDLPRVRYPALAQALYAELESGDLVPARFDAAMQQVWDEVDRQNGLTRFCRNQVAAGQFPPAPQPPNNQPPNNQPPNNPPPQVYYPPPGYPWRWPGYDPEYPRHPHYGGETPGGITRTHIHYYTSPLEKLHGIFKPIAHGPGY